MRFIVWTKIAYHNVCMMNTAPKKQEGINKKVLRISLRHAISTECYALARSALLACPEVSEKNKQRTNATAEGCIFAKISVKRKVMPDRFCER